MLERATAILRQRFGLRDFRPLQRRVIEAVLRGQDVVAVLPTGGGKSLCFQVPALQVGGLTLVVSPLIALMQDQTGRLRARGLPAAMLGGPMTPEQQRAILDAAIAGRIRLLYLSPERCLAVAERLSQAGRRVERLAVDEAHCIVEWGHDFRPSYRSLRQVRVLLGRPPCTALTASATPAVRSAIRTALGMGRGATEVVGSFDRPNLHFAVTPVRGDRERLARLVPLVRGSRASAIVYAPTRALVESLARALGQSGVRVGPYHAGMTPRERRDVLDGFLGDQLRVVTATCAFGMGIDKPDVRLVAHWAMPSTPEAYYQEAGRAGRDGRPGRCLMFHHPRDVEFPRRCLQGTFPRRDVVEAIWRDPTERQRHAAPIVASADRLAEELRPDRGPVEWAPVRRRQREAERRLAAMARYAGSRRCRRAVLLDWFGERVVRCAGCDQCRPRTGRADR